MGAAACLMMNDMVHDHAVVTGPLNSGVVLSAYAKTQEIPDLWGLYRSGSVGRLRFKVDFQSR